MINQYKQSAHSAEAQLKFYNLRKTELGGAVASERDWKAGKQSCPEIINHKSLFFNQIFVASSTKDFAQLSPHLEFVLLAADEELSQPGSDLRYIYFPETAVISHLHVLSDGSSTEIVMMGRESVVGLSQMLGSRAASYCTQVTIPGKALRIKAEILQKEFERGGTLQKLLLSSFNSHLTQVSQKVVCNIHHQAEARFCTWLLMLQDRAFSNNLRLTQDQIARYLGVHRPSITHIAQALREKEIINYVRSHINILNRQGLESHACECYQTLKEPALVEFAETIQ